jgi:hypothetical protein
MCTSSKKQAAEITVVDAEVHRMTTYKEKLHLIREFIDGPRRQFLRVIGLSAESQTYAPDLRVTTSNIVNNDNGHDILMLMSHNQPW